MQTNQLIQELAYGADLIPALLVGVTQAEAQIRPALESWSILEVVCHLYDEEREDFRQRLNLILHHPEADWPPIDPQGWVTARAYNSRDLAEMIQKWSAERAQSLAWLRGLVNPNFESQHTSPFGSMRAGDMLAAWVAHDNLHLRQLVELRRARLLALTTPYDVQYAGEW